MGDPWADEPEDERPRRNVKVLVVVVLVAAWAMLALLWLAWGQVVDTDQPGAVSGGTPFA